MLCEFWRPTVQTVNIPPPIPTHRENTTVIFQRYNKNGSRGVSFSTAWLHHVSRRVITHQSPPFKYVLPFVKVDYTLIEAATHWEFCVLWSAHELLKMPSHQGLSVCITLTILKEIKCLWHGRLQPTLKCYLLVVDGFFKHKKRSNQ